MTIEELNRLQDTVETSYSELGEGRTVNHPRIWEMIERAEKDLNAYFAAYQEYTDGFGSGQVPSDFNYSRDPLDPNAETEKIRAARADAQRRFEWITVRLRRVEHLKMDPNIQRKS